MSIIDMPPQESDAFLLMDLCDGTLVDVMNAAQVLVLCRARMHAVLPYALTLRPDSYMQNRTSLHLHR